MYLLQAGSVLVSVATVSIEGHADARGLGLNWVYSPAAAF